ncbi:MAG: hypothetical protein KF823_01895 [Xanthomonadales bacterium]|nr:hypothetical protein [Xanthomonadales bacterium]
MRAADAPPLPAAVSPAPPLASEVQRRRGTSEQASALTASEAASVPDAADADAELLAALALLDAGQPAEAAAAALEWQRRWPGLTLPDRLQALLPAD